MESSLVWDEMGMNKTALDFGQLFPEFTFDGQKGFKVTAHIPIRWGESYD